MIPAEQYLAQITKQLRERGLTDDQARIIVRTVTGYGLARYNQGWVDGRVQLGWHGED